MKVISRSFLGRDSFVTYPHTNAFLHKGEFLVYVQREEDTLYLQVRDTAARKIVRRQLIGPCAEVGKAVWTDVAFDGSVVLAIFKNRVWILDLEGEGDWNCLYRAAAGTKLDGLTSISKDGSKVVCIETEGDIRRFLEISVGTGKMLQFFETDWYADHIHYCPFDESWVAFSHEGPTETIHDRCWVWNAEAAPKGRPAFDQQSGTPGKLLYVGHERWGYHDVSAYVPAYSVSQAGPRGLYEIFGDGRPAKLRWESDVLWHVNMDPSGRFVVVDTTGPYRDEMLSEEEFRAAIDLHLKTDLERGRNSSDIVILDLQKRESLLMATVERHRHPYHPHPAISPDLRWVVWNDSRLTNQGAWIAEVSLEH